MTPRESVECLLAKAEDCALEGRLEMANALVDVADRWLAILLAEMSA